MDFNQLAFWLALLLSIFNLWDRIDARVSKTKEPTKLLEARLATMETLVTQRFSLYDDHFAKDLGRIEKIEEGNKVTQQALLALLNHAIDGNDIAEVRKASKDLTDYLIRR